MVNPRVGELQFGGIHSKVFIYQQIEVNHPRSVFLDDLLAESAFGLLKLGQQFVWGKGGSEPGVGID